VNVDHGIWSKLTKVVVGLIVLAVLLLIGMCYLPLIQENTRMRAQILKLDQQIQTEQKKIRPTSIPNRGAAQRTRKPSNASPAKNSATPSRTKRSSGLNPRQMRRHIK